MRYVTRTFLAMALFAFCWVAVGYAVFEFVQLWTCAGRGPSVSARDCSEGTEGLFLALFGGIGLNFVAAAIYRTRGTPPGSSGAPRDGLVVLWFWTGLFWSVAAGSFVGMLRTDADPNAGWLIGGLVVGFMGLIMGLGGLAEVKRRRTADPRRLGPVAARVAGTATARTAGTATPVSGGGDPVARLETLDRLRRRGAITDAEFETLKAKIIGKG